MASLGQTSYGYLEKEGVLKMNTDGSKNGENTAGGGIIGDDKGDM